jgi:hypothetical protein
MKPWKDKTNGIPSDRFVEPRKDETPTAVFCYLQQIRYLTPYLNLFFKYHSINSVIYTVLCTICWSRPRRPKPKALGPSEVNGIPSDPRQMLTARCIGTNLSRSAKPQKGKVNGIPFDLVAYTTSLNEMSPKESLGGLSEKI